MPAIAPRGNGRRAITEINMVPFIDVMLVLLIIFMVTAPLIVPGQVELPSVGTAARQPERFVHVSVARDGALRVRDSAQGGEGEPVSLRELPARVRALLGPPADGAPAVPVVISADRRATYEHVMQAMDALQRAGIARVGLAVRQDSAR
ncbi:Biopolymer transport protein ExbD [Tepidimonas alkaliphilus]|uniref:Biopolymer transport protein ExbD n=1 Tax=Tepidimonas alkaliphilus TaxID=2588942 RepID=A0A554W4P8_9BURK|nr:ExbD/TolR family protein [Tepidimonas alkaliphilus]TSE18541.1 Biopolymer transport protein ExbD [Tepidimonas alkaliphilus]